MSSPRPDLCPQHIQLLLQEYAEKGVPPGHWLQAVLCNDLRLAFGLADDENLPLLQHIVAYVYWEIPAICHGSHAKVNEHLKKFARTQSVKTEVPNPQPKE